MADQLVTAEFLNLIKKTRLLGDTASCASTLTRMGSWDMPTAEDAADQLVAEGLLTRYQANRLLEGRRRGLYIDNYKILEILGCGGMGYLYAAEEEATGWQVALKVLSDRYRSDKGRLTRFQLEAEAGLKLVHPNILRTRAIKRTEDIYGSIHYMVLELIKGIGLHELLQIRKRTLHWRQSCDVIQQAALGLQYAHEQGLVHRDVKPENLLIRSDGTVKVLDFGLAMISGHDAEFSLATILGQNCVGTADYIAPEQSLDSLEVDPRADIYSLGCTFYYLVTGRPPFPESSVAEKLNGHRTREPRVIEDVNPKTPRKICKIIRKMMDKKPERRLQSAADVSDILGPLAERKPIEFDFSAVLESRSRIAEHRLASESILRGDSRATTVSKLEIDPQADFRRVDDGSESTNGLIRR